jgi:hypothetical protein
MRVLKNLGGRAEKPYLVSATPEKNTSVHHPQSLLD